MTLLGKTRSGEQVGRAFIHHSAKYKRWLGQRRSRCLLRFLASVSSCRATTDPQALEMDERLPPHASPAAWQAGMNEIEDWFCRPPSPDAEPPSKGDPLPLVQQRQQDVARDLTQKEQPAASEQPLPGLQPPADSHRGPDSPHAAPEAGAPAGILPLQRRELNARTVQPWQSQHLHSHLQTRPLDLFRPLTSKDTETISRRATIPLAHLLHDRAAAPSPSSEARPTWALEPPPPPGLQPSLVEDRQESMLRPSQQTEWDESDSGNEGVGDEADHELNAAVRLFPSKHFGHRLKVSHQQLHAEHAIAKLPRVHSRPQADLPKLDQQRPITRTRTQPTFKQPASQPEAERLTLGFSTAPLPGTSSCPSSSGAKLTHHDPSSTKRLRQTPSPEPTNHHEQSTKRMCADASIHSPKTSQATEGPEGEDDYHDLPRESLDEAETRMDTSERIVKESSTDSLRTPSSGVKTAGRSVRNPLSARELRGLIGTGVSSRIRTRAQKHAAQPNAGAAARSRRAGK